MPAVSLVVCLYRQRDLLERLIRETEGCYDDLVIVHDGPDGDNLREFVEKAGGRFFAPQKREYQQEAHWPFAWAQARHNWILRLDADEFPSKEMKIWLQKFRRAPEPPLEISGFTCIWPLWNGQREITKKWAPGRIFLFHRQRVKFFGMVEQVPIPDGAYQPLDFVLHHQPYRKSYGFYNILMRKQAYLWRKKIAASLLGKPTDLSCWRWSDEQWPLAWEQIRRSPLRTAFKRLFKGGLCNIRDQWRVERKFLLSAAFDTAIHHALICIQYWALRRGKKSIP